MNLIRDINKDLNVPINMGTVNRDIIIVNKLKNIIESAMELIDFINERVYHDDKIINDKEIKNE